MTAIVRREVGQYFHGITGWLIAAFLMLFAGVYCMAYNLSGYYANFEYVLSSMSFIYLIAVPILSMRVLAEEKRQKTDQLLYSLPVSLSSIVIGKYLGMLVVLAFPMLLLCGYPLILMGFGNVQMPVAYGAILAFFLLGATLLSIGLFISSVMESQLASAILTLVTMLLLYFMSSLSHFVPSDELSNLIAISALMLIFAALFYILAKDALVSAFIAVAGIVALFIVFRMNASVFSGLFTRIMSGFSVFDRFESFVEGVFDLNAVVYYLSVIGVFLFLTIQSMEKRRWGE